jgi:hypothetical protein
MVNLNPCPKLRTDTEWGYIEPAIGFVRFWAGLRNSLVKNVLHKGIAIVDDLTTGSCNA